MIENVKCRGRQAQVRRLIGFVGGDRKIVTPADVKIDVIGADFGIARCVVRTCVVEAIAVGIGAGEGRPCQSVA